MMKLFLTVLMFSFLSLSAHAKSLEIAPGDGSKNPKERLNENPLGQSNGKTKNSVINESKDKLKDLKNQVKQNKPKK